MTEGWIKLHRKAKQSQVFKNAYLWQIWSWCLMEATHTEVWIPVKTGRGITEVHLLPGQFIFGRESAAEELEMNPSTLWKRMLKLKDLGNLKIESNSKYSVITLTNWDLYQSDPEKVTAKEQRNDVKSDSESGSENSIRDNGLRGFGDSESGSERAKKVTQTRSNKNNMLNQWFERFWSGYPRKIGKKKAREKFLRLSLDKKKFEKIMEALRAQKESSQWKRDRGQYIPHPATWIHGERWEDETTPIRDDEAMKDFIGQPLE